MATSSMADVDPASVPLPLSDGTRYSSSPAKSTSPIRGDGYTAEYDSTPQTVRPKRGQIADIFDTETPVVSAAFNPFRTPHIVDEEDDQETPRVRPSRRGGKYHPGTQRQTPASARGRRNTRSVPAHSSRHSSVSESEGEAEEEEGEEEGEEEEGGASEDEMETDDIEEEDDRLDQDMDQTIAISLESSVARQLGGAYPTSARIRRMTSPGQTPAKKMFGRNNDFTPGFNIDFPKALEQNTLRPSAFTNTSLPPSMFADIQATPFFSAPSPQRSSQRFPSNTPLSLSAVLRAKEQEVLQLREMLANTQDQGIYDDFIDFSPEKKISALEDPQLTVRKRRSPRKSLTTTSPIAGSLSRPGFRSSPIKPIGLFDGVTKPITAEERKRARRRRVTQEFRDFSCIDLDSLKIRPTVTEVIEEETPEIEVPEAPAQEQQLEPVEEKVEQEAEEKNSGAAAKTPAEDLMVEDEEEKKEKEEVKAEIEEETHHAVEEVAEVAETQRSSIIVPPLNRNRKYRSLSAPPTPRPEDIKAVAPKFLEATPMDLDAAHDAEVAKLNSTIIELQDKLEVADVQIDRLKAELIAERRMRIAAQQAQEFVELERKFGVCCEHNPGSKQRQEKLGPAAVQLPNSSPPVVAVEDTRRPAPARPKSRLGRPVSRFGDRPASRLGEHPSSRLGEHPTTASTTTSRLGNYAKPTVAAPATKKRAREEPKKAPVPARPEKKVLSGSAAGNIMLGSQHQQSGLAKKPEKVAGRNLRSSTTTGRPGALSRGARR